MVLLIKVRDIGEDVDEPKSLLIDETSVTLLLRVAVLLVLTLEDVEVMVRSLGDQMRVERGKR